MRLTIWPAGVYGHESGGKRQAIIDATGHWTRDAGYGTHGTPAAIIRPTIVVVVVVDVACKLCGTLNMQKSPNRQRKVQNIER